MKRSRGAVFVFFFTAETNGAQDAAQIEEALALREFIVCVEKCNLTGQRHLKIPWSLAFAV